MAITTRMLQQRLVRQPPSTESFALDLWHRNIADALNMLPPMSVFSFPNPNSNLSAIPGTLGLNINSATTAKAWIKEVGSGNTGWASLTTATSGSVTLASGAYVPTLTNVANASASSAYNAQWMRVGGTITVSGVIDVDPTAPATSTQVGISLPVASAFTLASNCAGTAFASGIAGQGAAILGDATNDRAQMQWISADLTNQSMYYTFTYVVV